MEILEAFDVLLQDNGRLKNLEVMRELFDT